ncbi:hypothetical protein J6X73_01905 [Candidatus Saccharibacteria bacterium]|nr:hypothetical protein [Candidatus Saccharibacteria bacterium]
MSTSSISMEDIMAFLNPCDPSEALAVLDRLGFTKNSAGIRPTQDWESLRTLLEYPASKSNNYTKVNGAATTKAILMRLSQVIPVEIAIDALFEYTNPSHQDDDVFEVVIKIVDKVIEASSSRPA